MAIDDWVKLLEAIAKLVGAIAWPALAAYVLLRFGPDFKEFFSSLGEFSLKAAGLEATVKRAQTEATAALTAAEATGPKTSAVNGTTAVSTKALAALVSEAVTPRALREARRATVLWVDDRPENNVYERQSLEALGVTFVLATSTEEAMRLLQTRHIDAIVSDMGRPPDQRAGYTLLDQLRKSGNNTPFIIYAGSNAPEHKAEAKRQGALGSTNRASELFELVLSALRTSH